MTLSPLRTTDATSPQLSLWPTGPADGGWRVRISERARHLSVRVHTGGQVEIVVPRWVRGRTVEQFVHRHRRWIERKVAELGARAPKLLEPVPSSIELAATGERWLVQMTAGLGAARVTMMKSGTIELKGDGSSIDEQQRALRSWLGERSREVLIPWLESLATEVGLAFKRTQIRRQRSRWGSCSVRGTVSLNCCLLFQRSQVVRYLLLHELCHTRHMNHSRRFWQLVSSFEPDYRALDRELLDGWQNVPAWVFGT